MKTDRISLPGIFSRIILFQFIILASAVFISGCYTTKKNTSGGIEMVVVFKTDVPIEKASSILFEKEYIFHEGTDNSKSEKYARETGPKYIVIVPKEKIADFNVEVKKIPQIYEVYQADWSANKK